MVRPFLIAALAAAPLPALAQEMEAAGGDPPERIRNVTVYGDEPCPKPVGDEIVVCGRISEEEMYRIPKRFREPRPTPANMAWGVRAESMMEANRAGLPNSCSPVGMGGQSGCTQMWIRQWMAEKAAKEKEEAKIP